jgi:uncharacterized membrane protein YhaH (DUF805 family)
MTFFESIKTVFRKYAEFGGRASRPEFWWFALFSALVASALGSLNLYSTTSSVVGGWMGSDGWMGSGGFDGSATSSTLYLGASLAGLWSVVVLLPSLAVTIRRLRDAGHNWAEIFWILLPIAGIIILIVRLADPTRTDAPAPVAAPPAPPAA